MGPFQRWSPSRCSKNPRYGHVSEVERRGRGQSLGAVWEEKKADICSEVLDKNELVTMIVPTVFFHHSLSSASLSFLNNLKAYSVF